MRLLLIAFFPSLFLSAAADEWSSVTVPEVWRKVPAGDLAPQDGYSWYRAFVRIPQEWQGTELTLVVEALDDARSGWVNGSEVGVNGRFPPVFRSGLGDVGRFSVPARLVHSGAINSIAIRVHQNDPRTNFNVAPPVLLNTTAMQAIRMNGTWQYRPGDDSAWAAPDTSELDSSKLKVFANVETVNDVDEFVARRDGDRPPLSVEEAAAAFQLPDDLRIEAVLSEPEIAQPLFLTWDERGRLWVMEYRQYPDPAGLKMISRDIYLRTVYDKVPLPPPHGVRGKDRITIHEDTDGDGIPDSHKTFVDGLNIATSMAIGRGGVFVTNPPYLLFYQDENHDDVPDGDPEVLLEGFGLEDSHSVINSLRFGPDGWLYGCQGSTVTGQVKRPGSKGPPIQTMGQQIWRYHPEQRVFEVFAEGGGNAFGLEIDAVGRIYSGHNGGDTRGFHYVQGGYYRKGFAKHGALSNPYTFGYFEAMKHHQVPRFTHNFVIYQSDALPDRYHEKLFGIEPLQGQLVLSEVKEHQSSFETSDLERVVRTDDPWFRPVDIKVGPDGCVFVADMYEQRIDHSSHYAGRVDRTNGRVWRVTPRNGASASAPPFDRKDIQAALASANRWQRETAVRFLADNPGAVDYSVLRRQISSSTGTEALSATWALHAVGGLTNNDALELLQHDDPYVREWVIRLLGDTGQVDGSVLSRLAELAATDSSIHVRKQLAASARRLSASQALPIIRALLCHDEDASDIHQPLMIWWAIEQHCKSAESRSQLIEQLLTSEAMWDRRLFNQHVLERLIKRLTLSGTHSELLSTASVLNRAPDEAVQKIILDAIESAFVGRSLSAIPQPLLDSIDAAGGGSIALQLRQGKTTAIQSAVSTIADSSVAAKTRIQLIQIMGDIRAAEGLHALLDIVRTADDSALLEATLSALHGYSDDAIGHEVVKRLPQLPTNPQELAVALLATRTNWTRTALTAVTAGSLSPDLFNDSSLRRMLLHRQSDVAKLIRDSWGSIEGATTAQMAAEADRLKTVLLAGTGNPKRGKPIYMKNCGRCHRLFGEGGQIGPDLTTFQRDDTRRLLENIVNPDLEIREGFQNFVVLSNDGRIATGFLVSQDDRLVVLRSTEGVSQTFLRDEIEEMRAVPQSVMPQQVLRELSDQHIRDLFAYLRSSQPVNY